MSDHHEPPVIQAPLPYQAHSGYGSAPNLVNVHGALLMVQAAMDLAIAAVGSIMIAAVWYDAWATQARGETYTAGAVLGLVTLGCGVPGLLGLLTSPVQAYAGLRLLRKKPRSWSWGLAGAVASCLHVWYCYAWILPLACGTFGLIVLFMSNTKRYISSWSKLQDRNEVRHA